MSKKFIEEVIAEFLKSPAPEVLCLRGKWGTGKSYTWRESLKRAVNSDAVALKDYAYVSLFGLNSLADLKATVVEGTIKLRKGGPLTTSVESVKDLLNSGKELGLKHTGLVSSIAAAVGFKGLQDASTRVMLLTLKDRLVCIDDLERRGNGLALEDVLGFASYLKEERDCKVVLILNDEALGEAKEAFENYLEKVVETAAVYSPTAEECVAIALANEKSKMSGRVGECATNLGLTNIRVIKRIVKMANKAEQLLANKDQSLLDYVAQSLCLLGWIHFMPKDAPTLEFVKDRYGKLSKETKENPEQVAKERRWLTALGKLDINLGTELDTALLQGLKDGYFNEYAVGHLGEIMERLLKKSNVENALEEAWQLYKGPLSVGADEIVGAMEKAVKEGVDTLSAPNIDGVVGAMRILGFEQRATELIEYIVANRKNERRYFNLNVRGGSQVADQELRAAFDAKAASFGDTRSLRDVIVNGAQFAGFGPDDIAKLREASVADFKAALLSMKSRDHEDALRALLPGLVVATNGKTVGENLREAAEELCRETRINEIRLRPILAEPVKASA